MAAVLHAARTAAQEHTRAAETEAKARSILTAAQEHTRAAETEAKARSILAPAHALAAAEELATAEQQTRAEATLAEALLPQEAAVQQMERALTQLDAERQTHTADQLEAHDWLAKEPGLRTALTTRLEAAQRAETDSVHQQSALADIRRRLEAAQQRDARLADVVSRKELLKAAHTATTEAAQAYITIRRQRTEGMAAELAAGLTDGSPCPVCGSCTHLPPRLPRTRASPPATTSRRPRPATSRLRRPKKPQQPHSSRLRTRLRKPAPRPATIR